mgnify:CR=1 FL=1
MAKQTTCYVLMLHERIGKGHQILAVYTSKKSAEKNKQIYQLSQAQALGSRNMFVCIIECNLNKVFE